MKVVILLAVLGGLYFAYQQKQSALPPDPSGFVSIPMPEQAKDKHVVIVAAQNCSKKAAQHADYLARSMEKQGVPYQRISSVQFQFTNRDEAEQVNKVMQAGPPIVFYQGKARSNPSLEEVMMVLGKTASRE